MSSFPFYRFIQPPPCLFCFTKILILAIRRNLWKAGNLKVRVWKCEKGFARNAGKRQRQQNQRRDGAHRRLLSICRSLVIAIYLIKIELLFSLFFCRLWRNLFITFYAPKTGLTPVNLNPMESMTNIKVNVQPFLHAWRLYEINREIDISGLNGNSCLWILVSCWIIKSVHKMWQDIKFPTRGEGDSKKKIGKYFNEIIRREN